MSWYERANCAGQDTNKFFDLYEENPQIRPTVDSICESCPVRRSCFVSGWTSNSWGVWGGIYLEDGRPSREFNSHKDISNMGDAWFHNTTDVVK